MKAISSQLISVFIVLFLQTIAIRFSALLCEQNSTFNELPASIKSKCPPASFPTAPVSFKKFSNYSLVGPWPANHPCGSSRKVGTGSPELLPHPKKSILVIESHTANAWKIAYTVRLLLRTFESDWRVQIVYPLGVRTQLEVWLLPYIRAGNIQFLQGISEQFNKADYDAMLKTETFWRKLWGDWVLVVDIEGSICPKNNPFAIEDFMCYDSIGAHKASSSDNRHAGTSGFVLRRKAMVLKAIAKFPEAAASPTSEDSFFEDKFKELQGTLPSTEVSNMFVAETPDVESQRSPFAWHKSYDHLRDDQAKTFVKDVCPEAGPLWNTWISNDNYYRVSSWPDSNPDPDWYRIPE